MDKGYHPTLFTMRRQHPSSASLPFMLLARK